MTRIYVQPASGRITLLPAPPGAKPRAVPAAGCWVSEDAFIARRLRDGDLVAATAPAPDDGKVVDLMAALQKSLGGKAPAAKPKPQPRTHRRRAV